jgi:para-nitrobenzyl esterase
VKAAADLVVEVQTAPDYVKWGPIALSQLPFAPTIDGEVLPRHPLEAFAAGASSDVKVLLGTNRQEARIFLVPGGVINMIDEPTLLGASGGYGLPAEALEVYRSKNPGATPGDILAQVVTAWFFGIPAIRHAEAREAGGGTTWAYRFDTPEPSANHGLGAAHVVEVPFVFDNLAVANTHPRIGDTPSQLVADTAHATWVKFVRDGDPGWAPYSTNRRTTGIFSDTITAVDDPDGDERVLWEGIR